MPNLKVTKNISEMCIECGICMGDCAFLPKVCDTPKELADRMLAGEYVAKPSIPFECNMCGKCAVSCPEGLDIGEMIQELRTQVFSEDIPLPGNIKYVKNQQKFVTSDKFFLAKPAPSGNTERMFFPGCHLSGYSAELVDAVWRWLNENDKDCGLLLTCCGAPSLDTGDVEGYQKIVDQVKEAMKSHGARELVTACTNCMKHFIDHTDIQISCLYELLDEKCNVSAKYSGSLVLHDPCKARDFSETQKAVRSLLTKTGCEFSEAPESGADAKCCGMGGLVAYTDAGWAGELAKERAVELGGDLVTYCASCRQAMRPYDREGLHLLDLLFTENPEEAKKIEAHGAGDTKANQLKTRELLSK